MKLPAATFFISILLSSCGNQFYYPKPLEPVLLTHATQLKINTISTASPLNGLTAFSVAYSPVKKLGLQIGFTTGGSNTKKENTNGTFTDTRREIFFVPYISTGYYSFIKNNFLFEIYGGIGLYKYTNKADAFVNKLQHYNFYLQPSVAFMHKNFEMVFTTRLDYLNRYNAETTALLAPVNPDSSGYKFLKYKNYLFFQPGVTFKIGIKRLKGQLQFSESFPFSSQYKSIYGAKEDYHLLKAGIGFTFDIDVKRKNKSR